MNFPSCQHKNASQTQHHLTHSTVIYPYVSWSFNLYAVFRLSSSHSPLVFPYLTNESYLTNKRRWRAISIVKNSWKERRDDMGGKQKSSWSVVMTWSRLYALILDSYLVIFSHCPTCRHPFFPPSTLIRTVRCLEDTFFFSFHSITDRSGTWSCSPFSGYEVVKDPSFNLFFWILCKRIDALFWKQCLVQPGYQLLHSNRFNS